MMISMTGNVIQVSHYNHGMQADNNFVTLADVEPDTNSVLLTDNLELNDQVISVASTSEFATYAGISTSKGYIKVGAELIYYYKCWNKSTRNWYKRSGWNDSTNS